MYSSSTSNALAGATPFAPEQASEQTTEETKPNNIIQHGWVGEEQIEIVGITSDNNNIGSISSSSLTQASLIALGTPLSVAIEEQEQKTHQPPHSKLAKFWAKTDLVSALSQYQNTNYLRQELRMENLPLLRKSVEELKTEIQKIPPNKERQKLEKLALNLIHKIDAISSGKKLYAKAATKLFFSLASISLCILPLMVAKKNNYNQVLAATISGYAKTMLILIGLIINQTADSRTFTRHLKERHIPYLTPNIPFALSTYNKTIGQFNKENQWTFNGISAVFCAIVFMATSSPDTFKKPIEKVFNKTKSFLDQQKPKNSEKIPQELADSLRNLLDTTIIQSQQFSSRRTSFENKGNTLNDVLSNQLSDINHASNLLKEGLLKAFNTEETHSLENKPLKPENTDFSRKLVFAILAALLCAGSAATVYDEPVGLIGAGVDAALTTGEMLKTALNPTANVQRASEKFGSYSGLTPFLLLFGLANKIPKKHFADSVAGLTVGTAVLIAATMTLPRTTSEILSKSILNMLNRVRKPIEAEQNPC